MNAEQLQTDLMEVFRGYKALIQEEVAQNQLSPSHLFTLSYLRKNGPSSMSSLAGCLELTQGAITGLVDRLEGKGLVERIHSTEDRRMVWVELTSEGEALQEHLLERARSHLAKICDLLEEKDRESVMKGINLFTKALKQYEGQARERTADVG